VVACSPRATSPSFSSKPLKVVTGTWPGFLGGFIALEKGFFAEEGIRVEETVIPDFSAAITAFLSGQGDILWGASADAIQISSQDPSARVFFLVDYSNGGDGIIGRNINSPQDVKGKTVALEDALLSHIILNGYLQPAGLTEKDVLLLKIPLADATAAFTAKRIDVAVSALPWLTTATQQSDGKIIFSTKDTNLVADVLITRQEVLDTRKSELQAYVRAVDRGVKMFSPGDPDTLRIVAERTEVDDLKQVEEQLALIKLFDIEGNKTVGFNPDNPNNLMKNLEFTAQVAYDLEIIPKPLDVSTLYDDSVVNSL
jgi:NitT/TauT family transport system substrate-binding protein